MKSANYRLQFITHYNKNYSYIDSARIALEGGCRWVQLRIKDADENLIEKIAIIVQKMCKEYNATFIINDNVPLAKKLKADGVHLGKNDMPIVEARRILGKEFIIGSTVNTYDDILHNMEGGSVDYFGCGPFHHTSTKKDLAPILGYEGYRDLIRRMQEENIKIPVIAIGGIAKEDITQLLYTGVDGIALSSSVLQALNPVEEMSEIVRHMNTNFY